jgi:hypothetical protein
MSEEEYDETATLPPRLPWVLICHRCCQAAWTVNHVEVWADAVRSRQEHEGRCEGAFKPAPALV